MQETKGSNKQDLKRLEKLVKEMLGEEYDKYDLKSAYDSSLSYGENKEIILQEISTLFDEDGLSVREKIKEEEEKEGKCRDERNRLAVKEVQEFNNKEPAKVDAEVKEIYSRLESAVSKVCLKKSSLACIMGAPGIGKSFNIRRVIKEHKADFVEVSGVVTPAYLYRLLYEAGDQVVWFKDVGKLLTGGSMDALSILKAATETEEKRLVSKKSYGKHDDDLPDCYLVKSRIIFDINSLDGVPNRLRKDFSALISRGEFVELSFSPEDMKEILSKTASNDVEKEVTDFLVKNHRDDSKEALDLRTRFKAVGTREYCEKTGVDWRACLKEELGYDLKGPRALVYGLIGDRIVRAAELKRLLLRRGIVASARTADRKLRDWLCSEDLYVRSLEANNMFVSLKPGKEKIPYEW